MKANTSSLLAKLEGKIREVMVPLPLVVEPSASFYTVGRLMQRYDIRHLPVVEGEKILGLIHERDILAAKRSQAPARETESIRHSVESAFLEVSPEAKALDVMHAMNEKKYDCALVLNAGKVVGIFTLSDALRLLLDTIKDCGA